MFPAARLGLSLNNILRASENRVLRRIFGLVKDQVARCQSSIMKSAIICTLHKMLLNDRIREEEVGGACSAHGMDT
jgi:hypothetical protein